MMGSLMRAAIVICFTVWTTTADVSHAVEQQSVMETTGVDFQWGRRIVLRDGIKLSSTLYLPRDRITPKPCVFTLTPYVSDTYHTVGIYFASHGLPFVIVDVRGRGNSQGVFHPFTQEAKDGYDIVEWLAKQPYCNGKVAMWGGSYAGYDQWATAKELPPHLATVVPTAAPQPGVEFPARNNIFGTYLVQWILFTSGHTSQERIFWGDLDFWNGIYRHWFESGQPFDALDRFSGNLSPVLHEWLSHPDVDAYWDSMNPSIDQYAKMQIPILTITGSYDDDQVGALAFYRQHMRYGNPAAKSRHFLIIGPWDHEGTRTPKAEFGGLKFGPASMVDLFNLHLQWYAWTMQDGVRPEFLKKSVAYYVMGADKWRYADTLGEITDHAEPYYLQSGGEATDAFTSGTLGVQPPRDGRTDSYVYDPRDIGNSDLESWSYGPLDPVSLVDQREVLGNSGAQLIYHSAPFKKDTQISGFFKLSVWLAIDQPDTDFGVSVYEVGVDGNSILLGTDILRARYRESLREPRLVRSTEPMRYDFDRFAFVSREIRKRSRLRVVIGPINSIYSEKNYNTGGVVARETMKDARPVRVELYHDQAHPSALYVPVGQADPQER